MVDAKLVFVSTMVSVGIFGVLLKANKDHFDASVPALFAGAIIGAVVNAIFYTVVKIWL